MILNPSRIATFLDCPYKFALRYRFRLRMPRFKRAVSLTRELGTLYHAAAEGYDRAAIALADSDAPALERANTLQRTALHHLYTAADELKAEYPPAQHATIDTLADEVRDHMLPQYAAAPHHHAYTIAHLEYVPPPLQLPTGSDVPGPRITAKLDRVVVERATVFERATGNLYPWERKVTARDDSSWRRSWSHKIQTTVHALLYGVTTAIVEQVVVTRRKLKGLDHQPISRVTHHPPRAIYKLDAIRQGTINTILKVARLMQGPTADMYQNWESCWKGHHSCDFIDHCRGLVPLEELDPADPDYIDALETEDKR